MATVGALKQEARQSMISQAVRDEVRLYKATIIQIDSFVEALVERLENPNKTFFGAKAPVDPSDLKFKECILAIKSYIGNAVNYRKAITKTVPPQYGKLAAMMANIAEGSSLKGKYNIPRFDFLDNFKKFMLFLTQKNTSKIPECSPYSRVSNLFNSITKDPKYHFDYQTLYDELNKITKRVDDPTQKAKVNEILDQLEEEIALDVRTTMPYPPIAPGASTSTTTTTSSSTPGEPAPNVSQSEIDSELSTTSTTTSSSQPKKPLTSFDKMKIAGIAAQISKDPRTAQRQLSMAQIQQMAENIYRKKTGMGRKTYRKKVNKRKTRKVRSV